MGIRIAKNMNLGEKFGWKMRGWKILFREVRLCVGFWS